MKDIRLIDTRRYMELKNEKLKPEDRRLLLTINHNEVLFNENMLLQNRILVIAIFALFAALLSLIIPLQFISNILKIIVVTVFSIFALYLLILFSNAIKRVKNQNNNIKTNYDELFKYHFAYANKERK